MSPYTVIYFPGDGPEIKIPFTSLMYAQTAATAIAMDTSNNVIIEDGYGAAYGYQQPWVMTASPIPAEHNRYLGACGCEACKKARKNCPPNLKVR